MFIEAALLHMIDLIDARVYMFNDITKDLEDNTFSQKMSIKLTIFFSFEFIVIFNTS